MLICSAGNLPRGRRFRKKKEKILYISGNSQEWLKKCKRLSHMISLFFIWFGRFKSLTCVFFLEEHRESVKNWFGASFEVNFTIFCCILDMIFKNFELRFLIHFDFRKMHTMVISELIGRAPFGMRMQLLQRFRFVFFLKLRVMIYRPFLIEIK